MEMFSSFFNLLQERFIRQRWSLWPSFVLLGSLWTPLQATEGKEESQALIFSGISYSPSSQPRYPSGVLGDHAGSALQPEQTFCRAGQRLLQNRTPGVLPPSREGPGEGRAPRGATSTRKEQSGRRGALGMLLNEEPERLCRLQGQLRGDPSLGGSTGWDRGLAGPAGQPGGLSSAQPRAVLHAGCRRSAGLGAGRLSIFSEGFIEWIPAVWLHTEILS